MAKSNLAKKTRQYSLDFKRKTVEMTLNPEVLIKDVAERMDIHPFMLSRWRKEYREGLLKPSRRRKPWSLVAPRAQIGSMPKTETCCWMPQSRLPSISSGLAI